MKKLVLAGLGLFMMAGFLPMQAEEPDQDIAYGCVATTCAGTFCHEGLADPDNALWFSDLIEDNVCNTEPE